MPAEPPAPRRARSYQLSKFRLFNFILPSGTFSSLIFPKHSLWRKETYSSGSVSQRIHADPQAPEKSGRDSRRGCFPG